MIWNLFSEELYNKTQKTIDWPPNAKLDFIAYYDDIITRCDKAKKVSKNGKKVCIEKS